MKLVPLGDRIILKEEVAEEKTESGIILTGSAKEKPSYATVVAVGPGGLVEGHEVKMLVKPKDKVMYAKYSGTEVKFEGEEYIIIRQADVLAIVK